MSKSAALSIARILTHTILFYLVAPNFKDDFEERILLLIHTDQVIPEIKWEDSEGWEFPHIYGLLNTDAIEAILPHLWSEDWVWTPNEELDQYRNNNMTG